MHSLRSLVDESGDSSRGRSNSRRQSKDSSLGLQHPFRLCALDGLLDVMLFGAIGATMDDVTQRATEFISLLNIVPVTDFQRAFGGIPALARAGSPKMLSAPITSRSAYLAPLLQHGRRGRTPSFADFCVFGIANPDLVPFEEWRRAALTFDHHLGTYRYSFALFVCSVFV